MKSYILCAFLLVCSSIYAQVGSHRNELSVGFNGGYVMSNVGFIPKVTQDMHGGIVGGLSVKYVSEKYFKSICSIFGEVNFVQSGWKENIVTLKDEPVINAQTKLPEEYSRTINYIQVPIFAHLAWGKETKGFQFFFQAGPQFGYMLSEQTKINFDINHINKADRANTEATQYSMPIEHKFDYGIVAGIGLEYSHPKVGHFLLDTRYYYGLANLYGESKRDYFARSNISNIQVKITYLFDILHKTSLKYYSNKNR